MCGRPSFAVHENQLVRPSGIEYSQKYSVKEFEETIALQVIQSTIGASFERG